MNPPVEPLQVVFHVVHARPSDEREQQAGCQQEPTHKCKVGVDPQLLDGHQLSSGGGLFRPAQLAREHRQHEPTEQKPDDEPHPVNLHDLFTPFLRKRHL